MEKSKKFNDRIWIELERPENDDQGLERATLLCIILKRLGVSYQEPVFWHTKQQSYCFQIDGSGAYVEASDNGHWYNLDYLADQEGE